MEKVIILGNKRDLKQESRKLLKQVKKGVAQGIVGTLIVGTVALIVKTLSGKER